METGKMKLALSAGALALSMVLAGCGGSSSGTGPENPNGGSIEMPTIAKMITDLRPLVAAAEEDGATDAEVKAAEEALMELKAAIAETDDDVPNSTTLLIEKYEEDVKAARAALTAASNAAGEAMRKAALVIPNAVAKAIEGYVPDPSSSDTPITVEQLAAGDPLEVSTSISPSDRDNAFGIVRIGNAVAITLNRSTEDKEDRKLTETAARSVGEGWVGRAWAYEADEPKNGEIAAEGGVVYTNIEAPEDGAADTDHLTFGYWVTSTRGSGDSLHSYGIETFARGIGTATGVADDVTELTGTATYSGAAAGWYARQVFSDNGEVQTASQGPFTAKASLTATFGQNTEQTIGPGDLFSIRGEIFDFHDADTEAELAGWKLMLNRADMGDEGGALENFSGTTGPTANPTGAWTGSMHGNEGAETTTGEDAAEDDFPTGVVGEFKGSFSNGDVAGAFGATKTAE